MRWIILACCLLIPAASAQAILPMGAVGTEEVYAPVQLHPYETGFMRVQGVYSCHGSEAGTTLRVYGDARGTIRGTGEDVPMNSVATSLVDIGSCADRPGMLMSFDIDATWSMANFTQDDILDVKLEWYAEAGEGPTGRSSDTMDAATSIALRQIEQPVALVDEAPQSTADQSAPGPALPLLAAGLLALARRR